LNLSGAAAALALAWLGGSSQLLSPVLGLLAALGIGLLLFLLRLLGAGDAKFMAAIGAWAGLSRLPMAFLAMLAGGALVALVWSWRQRMLKATLMSTATMVGGAVTGAGSSSPWVGHTAAGRFPYGVGLGLGAIAWWLWEGCRLI
jgi:prepilin peptidase CpaA